MKLRPDDVLNYEQFETALLRMLSFKLPIPYGSNDKSVQMPQKRIGNWITSVYINHVLRNHSVYGVTATEGYPYRTKSTPTYDLDYTDRLQTKHVYYGRALVTPYTFEYPIARMPNPLPKNWNYATPMWLQPTKSVEVEFSTNREQVRFQNLLRDFSKAGKPLHLLLDQKCEELRDLLDWMLAEPEKLPRDITRLSVAQAQQGAKRWHEALDRKQQKKREAALRNKGDRVLIASMDKYRLYILKDEQALVSEGVFQHHCVASYWHYVWSGRCAILSLEYDSVRYTIELGWSELDPLYEHVAQIRGLQNSEPPADTRHFILSWLEKHDVEASIREHWYPRNVTTRPTYHSTVQAYEQMRQQFNTELALQIGREIHNLIADDFIGL